MDIRAVHLLGCRSRGVHERCGRQHGDQLPCMIQLMMGMAVKVGTVERAECKKAHAPVTQHADMGLPIHP